MFEKYNQTPGKIVFQLKNNNPNFWSFYIPLPYLLVWMERIERMEKQTKDGKR